MKTIEQLVEERDAAWFELNVAMVSHNDHWTEAMRAQADVVKWRRVLDEAESALHNAHGEPS